MTTPQFYYICFQYIQFECFRMSQPIQSEYIQIECFCVTNVDQFRRIQIECFGRVQIECVQFRQDSIPRITLQRMSLVH